MFFDHCLARDWALYADQPLEHFTSQVYRVLAAEPQLPGRLAQIAPYMAADDWLGSYREFAVMEQVLRGISRRLTQPQALEHAMQELRVLYEPLSEDFRMFYPQLQAFAQDQLTTEI